LRSLNRVIAKDSQVCNYKQEQDMIQSLQLQIGSRLYPDYPITSSTEAFYMLRKAFNFGETSIRDHVHSFNIKSKEYLDHKFVIVFDTEKVNGHTASFTGLNVKNGDQMTLKKRLLSSSATLLPEDCHIVLEAEQAVEITANKVYVAD